MKSKSFPLGRLSLAKGIYYSSIVTYDQVPMGLFTKTYKTSVEQFIQTGEIRVVDHSFTQLN